MNYENQQTLNCIIEGLEKLTLIVKELENRIGDLEDDKTRSNSE